MRESVKEWLKDLRSGQFNQTVEVLKFEDKDTGTCAFCCLGVAVETYKRVTGKEPVQVESDEETLMVYPEVQAWLGLTTEAGGFGEISLGMDGVDYRYSRLTHLNDTAKLDFNQIADFIESNPNGLFRE
jgi:hypothetical protein